MTDTTLPNEHIPLDVRLEALREPLWASTAHLAEIVKQLHIMVEEFPSIKETTQCDPFSGYLAESLMYAVATAHEADEDIFNLLFNHLHKIVASIKLN